MSPAAWAVDYGILHSFGQANVSPSSGLTVDDHGNAYGTTAPGCGAGAGTVYEMSPTSGYHQLYHFSCYGSGGNNPQGNLAVDSAGNLYGTTTYGGNSSDGCSSSRRTCGTVFELSPPPDGVGSWTETLLYAFCSQANCTDGANPQSGVIIDSEGNLYGTTFGVVFELSPPPGGNGPWTETVLHTEKYLYGSLVFDNVGNLYGTTTGGGVNGGGTAFELSPAANGWIETVLYNFCSQPSCADGDQPSSSLTFDGSGNLYGTTSTGGRPGCVYDGSSGCGTVFELTPNINGSWTETILHAFSRSDGATPLAAVVLDPAGNVYGTTYLGGSPACDGDGFGCGTVFRLTPKNGLWSASVFRFAGYQTGSNPAAPLTLDSTGNVYGTTTIGGRGTLPRGVVFRITQ
jgi:uncharacterized repeat protein (TIGR03803 family)